MSWPMPGPEGPPEGPLVVTCLRITDLRPEVDALTGSVRQDAWGIGLSAADGAALELALRIAGSWSGRLLAVAAGPPSTEPVLRQVAALGVSVVGGPVPAWGSDHYVEELGEDEHELARTLVAAMGPWGQPSLVLCGDRSPDRGTGALPAFLAHELGAAQALGLVALEPVGPGPGGLEAGAMALSAERRLDGGWRERLQLPLPAVCSVEAAGIRLRRASLAGVLATEGMVVPHSRDGHGDVVDGRRARGQVHLGPSRAYAPRTRVLPPPPGDDPRTRLLALTGALVSHDPPTVVGPLGSAEAADELIGFLVRHGYLDQPPDDLGQALDGLGQPPGVEPAVGADP
jgi:electron transfer flavoprotein beta subunit